VKMDHRTSRQDIVVVADPKKSVTKTESQRAMRNQRRNVVSQRIESGMTRRINPVHGNVNANERVLIKSDQYVITVVRVIRKEGVVQNRVTRINAALQMTRDVIETDIEIEKDPLHQIVEEVAEHTHHQDTSDEVEHHQTGFPAETPHRKHICLRKKGTREQFSACNCRSVLELVISKSSSRPLEQ